MFTFPVKLWNSFFILLRINYLFIPALMIIAGIAIYITLSGMPGIIKIIPIITPFAILLFLLIPALFKFTNIKGTNQFGNYYEFNKPGFFLAAFIIMTSIPLLIGVLLIFGGIIWYSFPALHLNPVIISGISSDGLSYLVNNYWWVFSLLLLGPVVEMVLLLMFFQEYKWKLKSIVADDNAFMKFIKVLTILAVIHFPYGIGLTSLEKFSSSSALENYAKNLSYVFRWTKRFTIPDVSHLK